MLELPSVYAVAPAERFASAAVRTLRGDGRGHGPCFRLRSADLQTLYQISDIIASEPPALQEAIKSTFPWGRVILVARFDALSEYGVRRNHAQRPIASQITFWQ